MKVKIIANGQNWLREQNDIPVGTVVSCSDVDRTRGCAWVLHPDKGHDVRLNISDIKIL